MKSLPTQEEIIGALKRSSVPTLLVEGRDDQWIYHWMVTQIGMGHLDIIAFGGRDTLISIYRQRHLFPTAKVVYLADRDMWRFSDPDDDLDGIIFTTGYSIENDIYASSKIENLLEPDERTDFQQFVDIMCRWFAFELGEREAGRIAILERGFQGIIDSQKKDLSDAWKQNRNYINPPPELVRRISDDYRLNLRGKNLFDTLSHVLSDQKRGVAKYNQAILMEIALKYDTPVSHLKSLLDSIELAIR